MKTLFGTLFVLFASTSYAEVCTYQGAGEFEEENVRYDWQCKEMCEEASFDNLEPSHGEYCYFGKTKIDFGDDAKLCEYVVIDGEERTFKKTADSCVSFCKEMSKDAMETSYGEFCYYDSKILDVKF